ncbi:MAG: TolC family protein [Gammaproteobacteria bacterium]
MPVVRQVALPFLVGAALLLNACTVRVPALERDDALRAGEARLERIRSEQQLPSAPLDVADAVARALMYNLDYRASFMNEAMAKADLSRTSFALWPQLALGAGYTSRDEYAASTSANPETGIQTLQSSTSSEKQSTTAQLQLSWNALDFGVGYLRAKQKGNALLVAEEQRRKAFQSITQEVTFAWWRALAAQRLEPRLQALRERVESALTRSRRMEELRLQTQVPILDYRRDLLLSLKRLSALQEEVLNARNDLSRLVSLPPGTTLELQEPAAMNEPGWLPDLSREQLLRIALANRPELREQGYRQRMARLEGKIAVTSLLPSLNLSAGPRYDSNKYLQNNDWNEASAQFSFNLLNLAAVPAARRYGKAAEAAESLRSDAMTVAVVAQVGIALRAIETDRRGWCLSRELDRVAGEREAQSRARAASASGDELSLIRTEVEAVLAALESAFSFAELEASHALLLNTLGVDPYPEDLSRKGPGEVAAQLRSYLGEGLRSRLAREADEIAPLPDGELQPALKPFEELCVI